VIHWAFLLNFKEELRRRVMRIYVKIKKVPKVEKRLQKAIKYLRESYDLIERYGIDFTTASIPEILHVLNLTEKIEKTYYQERR